MGLLDFAKKQFIDVIQCTEDGDDVLAWRFPMQDMEIQNGASLTVRESQMAIFVNEGKVADVFGPGRYILTTQTLPVLTNLKNWDKLFESPFKSDVYFFSTRHRLDRKWGTQNPITIRDKDFGMVRMRAFGIYSYKIEEPKVFHQKLSGTKEVYTVSDLEGQLRNMIVAEMSDAFGSSGVPFIDMASNQSELAALVSSGVSKVFVDFGLSLESFVVQNVSLPEELQQMLDKRIGINMMGNLDQYTKFQVAESIPLAAQNEGGLAGLAAGAGAGLGIGQQIAASMSGMSHMNAQPSSQSPTLPPTQPVPAETVYEKIEKLHALKEKGVLTAEEFAAKKAELLAKVV